MLDARGTVGVAHRFAAFVQLRPDILGLPMMSSTEKPPGQAGDPGPKIWKLQARMTLLRRKKGNANGYNGASV